MLQITDESFARSCKGMHPPENSNCSSSGSDWKVLSSGMAITSLEGGMALASSLEGRITPPLDSLACILQKCRKERDLSYALRLHAYMCESGLEAHQLVGNYLVSMLVDVGSMFHAQQVFERLVCRNECSWNALITGYANCGESRNALVMYQKMREDSIHPSPYTVVVLLKACAKLKDVERGCKIHAEIARNGLVEGNHFVGSALIDMYAKCGLLAKAQEVFNMLPVRDVVSWNALMGGYAKHGCGEEALNCLKKMQIEGVSPNAITFLCSLQACGSMGAKEKAQETHVEIARKGLEGDLLVGSCLVDMYAKCGLLAKAQRVFDMLPVRSIVSWNALIAGYAKQGHGEEAFNCFKQMQHEGVLPDAVTFICILKACGSMGATEEGRAIHAAIARKRFLEGDLLVGNALVDMYTKCGLLVKAQELFDSLRVRDVVSWNSLIAGYAKQGLGEEALNRFEWMQCEGISPDAVTFVCSLKACGSIGAADKGRELHVEIARKGFLERDHLVGNALVDMYAKCGLLEKAQEVFDKLPVRGLISWTALIGGYAEHGCGEKALKCFEQMQLEGISPNTVTFICSLKACGSIGATEKGQEIHAQIARNGLLEKNLVVGSTLVDMYAKFGLLEKAEEVLDKLPTRDAVSWNAVIAGYVKHGCGEEALNCFKQMQVEGVYPNSVTFICSLKACSTIGATDNGLEIHAEIARKGLLTKDLLVGNALVDMYAKCGLLVKAQEVFDKLPVRDVVSWTALIAGYAKHEHGKEALKCFEQMQLEGFSPNATTLVFCLKACGSIGVPEKAQEIHAEIARKGLEGEVIVGSMLVNLYSKCGLLLEAQEVFDKLPIRDIVSWNALISGYAELGESESVFDIFERMKGEGEKPDLVTFISVLTACSRAGLVDNGQRYFDAMGKDYGLTPTLGHHICMVDLLGRAGDLDKVVEMMKMSLHSNFVLWHTVLGVCRNWGNAELGRQAFEYAVQLDEKHAAVLACT